MKKFKSLLAKGAATHLIWVSHTLPGLLKTRGFTRLMNRIFSGMAPAYDRIWKEMGKESIVLGPLRTGLETLTSPPGFVLDLACGTGLATLEVKRCFPEASIFGADLSEPMIQVMREKIRENHLHGLSALVSNSASLPFPGETFDLVLIQNAPPYPEEMVRVLRPGGTLLLAYSFAVVSLTRRVIIRRLESLPIGSIRVLPSEQGMAVLARKNRENAV